MEDAHGPATRRPEPEAFSFEDVPRLTCALAQADEAAFLWLHERWSRRIQRLCFMLAAGEETLAADVAQVVWHRMARHVRVLPDETALWNWIARAARHALADQRRTGRRYRRALERFMEWWAPSATPAPDDAGADLSAALESALASVTGDERALIEARYFERASLAHIGERLGLNERAVEGRLARLRQRLRTLMKEHLHDPHP